MRRVKQLIPTLLVLAAFVVALLTLLTDHQSDYGSVAMPDGGTVELPEGTVTVFYEEAVAPAPSSRLAAPVSFEVLPAAGGPAVPLEPTAKNGTSQTQVQRSEDVTSLGSVAKLDVPAEDSYLVRVHSAGVAGSSLDFGTDRLTAVARRWRTFATLIGLAALLALIPIPRGWGRGAEDDEIEWSSDPRAPYAANR